MNHRIRYLLFRIAATVIFHIAWMDERTRRGADDTSFTASNGVTVNSTENSSPCISADISGDDDISGDLITVELRSDETCYDLDVDISSFGTPDRAQQVIDLVQVAIAEWARQAAVDVGPDPQPNECGPGGMSFNLA